MYLTGPEIARLVAAGDITIDPLDPDCIGPNSIDLHLHPEMRIYSVQASPYGGALDMRREPHTESILVPPHGLVLKPGILYLGRTVEHTEFPNHVAQITGRSSVGRLGIQVHITAGLGDIGFRGTWTLEITVVHPVRVYANVPICQLYIAEATGERLMYQGRYLDQVEATPSRFHRRP